MRFRRAATGSDDFFGVWTDGGVTRGVTGSEHALTPIAEKLPPAYDLAIVP